MEDARDDGGVDSSDIRSPFRDEPFEFFSQLCMSLRNSNSMPLYSLLHTAIKQVVHSENQVPDVGLLSLMIRHHDGSRNIAILDMIRASSPLHSRRWLCE